MHEYKLSTIVKIRLYWIGLKLKPTRMQGNSGEHTWVVASSHPPYSITWTWALYWRNPFNKNIRFNWKTLATGYFHFLTQEQMIRQEYEKIW